MKKLANTPDGDGSFLDHTDADVRQRHEQQQHPLADQDIPLLTAGRLNARCEGRIAIAGADGMPHANVLVDIVNKFGVDFRAHGVSNGRFIDLVACSSRG